MVLLQTKKEKVVDMLSAFAKKKKRKKKKKKVLSASLNKEYSGLLFSTCRKGYFMCTITQTG